MSKSTKVRVFVPLTKVDEEQRLVYGTITQEEADKAGETMDYETSKPNFEKWSNDISTASGGLSKGNVRVMHGLNVAGKLTDINFDDETKSIDVCAKVVDDAEWVKVQEGCYTGFSVGGSYGKKWTDPTTKMKKYTAVPNEVSLVDNPCVTSATFTLVKADGAEEEVSFKDELIPEELKKAAAKEDDSATGSETKEETEAKEGDDKKKTEEEKVEKTAPALDLSISNADVAARATELAKADASGKDWMDFIVPAREQLTLEKAGKVEDEKDDKEDDEDGDDKPKAKPGKGKAKDDDEAAGDDKKGKPAFGKVTPPGVTQKWSASDGKTFTKKEDAVAYEEALSKAEKPEDDDVTSLTKRLGRIKDLLNKNEDEVELGEPAAEPSILSLDRIDDLHKAVLELELPREQDASPKLEKGMYTVSRFAKMIGEVAELSRTIKAEGAIEGGDKVDSEVAKGLIAQLSTFGDSFIDYAKQQIGEVVAGLDTDLSPRACYDYYYCAVENDPENGLAKNVCELIEAVEDETKVGMEKLAKLAPVVEAEDTPETLAKLNDVVEENGRLTKIVTETNELLGTLEKRLKIVEDTPQPRAPRGNILNKGADGNVFADPAVSEEDKMAALGDLLKSKSPDEIAVMMIKASQATGGQKMQLIR